VHIVFFFGFQFLFPLKKADGIMINKYKKVVISVKVLFIKEVLHVIKGLGKSKNHSGRQFLRTFPERLCSGSGLDKLYRKIRVLNWVSRPRYW